MSESDCVKQYRGRRVMGPYGGIMSPVSRYMASLDLGGNVVENTGNSLIEYCMGP